MHDESGRPNLFLRNSPVHLGEVPHTLEQHSHERIGHATDFSALLFERTKSISKSAVKLVAKKKAQ
jgi:hypothetical protein